MQMLTLESQRLLLFSVDSKSMSEMYHEINKGEGKGGRNVIGRKRTVKRVTIELTDLLLPLFLMSIDANAEERRLYCSWRIMTFDVILQLAHFLSWLQVNVWISSFMPHSSSLSWYLQVRSIRSFLEKALWIHLSW